MSSDDYIDTSKVTSVRVYYEDVWTIDGADEADGYTEACWTFDTEEEARAAVGEFCEVYNIPAEAKRP